MAPVTTALGLGYSPCPNDTFLFHALVHGLVPCPGVTFEPWLADVEELNRRASGPDPLALTKLSVGALAAVASEYAVLSAGAALGRGVGPLVVTRAPRELGDLSGARIAVPGVRTTAFLLLRLFGPRDLDVVEMRFDRILDAVSRGDVDAGLIIHESRFTFRGAGLCEVADMGRLWEQDTGLPLPLGVIAAARNLDRQIHDSVEASLAESVRFAFADPSASRGYVAAHAQEMSAEVCAQHIGLYVNDWTVDLGEEGRAAIDALLARGRALGLLGGTASPWRD
jgi:1,4-dihydroxy-6-naphthoate synthase